MNESRLEQMQQDLNTIKSALPTDFPYDRGSVALCLGAGLCGGVFALRGVPGWDGPVLVGLLASLVALLVGAGAWLRHVRRGRAARPRRWIMGRQEAIAAALALLAFAVHAVLLRWISPTAEDWTFSQWRSSLAGPGLFGFGAAMLVLGIVQPERRSFLGIGAAMGAVALVLPWFTTYAAFRIACGTAILIGSVLSAAILWTQIRRWEAAHAGN